MIRSDGGIVEVVHGNHGRLLRSFLSLRVHLIANYIICIGRSERSAAPPGTEITAAKTSGIRTRT